MSTRRATQKGFTLVEILIVVVILGILAAIVVPQFTSASESARGSSLVTLLQTIRSQLELAQIQHNGTYPDLVTDGWAVMTSQTETDIAYTIPATPDGNEVGPYLQQPPNNPFENSSTVVASTTAAAAGQGWNYDVASGAIFGVVAATTATDLNLTASDVVTY